MLLEGEFKFQELIEYARKWVANPGTPTINAKCKMINQNHMAAALVFDFATKFRMQEKDTILVDVTKAGMPEHAMVDVGMMSNYMISLSSASLWITCDLRSMKLYTDMGSGAWRVIAYWR